MRGIRALLALLFLAGSGLIIYPLYVERVEGRDYGRWRAFDRSGPRPVLARLPRARPAIAVLDVTLDSPLPADLPRLAVVVTAGHVTLLRTDVDLASARPRLASPQAVEAYYRISVGTIAPGRSEALVAVSAADGASSVRAVDLVLRAAVASNPLLQPAGFILAAVGAVAFLRTYRSHPAPRALRWGRQRDAGVRGDLSR